MRNKHSLLVSLLLTLAITAQLSCMRRSSTGADPSASPSPSEQAQIDQILQRYDEALGGREALDAIKSYKLKGTFQIAGLTGTFQAWRKDPNKYATMMEFPRVGTLKKGFDGETSWVKTPAGARSDKSQEEIAKMERDAAAYGATKIKDLFHSMKLEHKARLNGRDVHMIEAKPERGPAEKLFFDVENGLLVRWDMARRESNRTIFVKVHLDDYREFGGTKTAYRVRFAFEQFNLIVQIDEAEFNIPLDDAIFRKP
jgi:zinc protease